jgi:Zn-dependent peptidase ImmA (M78 family)/transcriptional regulator with XRE-family HTH domain
MRRMSGASLSELVGVSRQAIANYESGQQTPSPDVLRRLADKLGFPIHRFTMPRPPVFGGGIYWRSIHSATKAERMRSQHRVAELANICWMIESSVQLPAVNFPAPRDLGLPTEPEKLTTEMIEQAAQDTRRFWGLGDGPISNVVWLLENHGAIVARQFLDAPKLDAFSRWMVTPTNRPVIILGTDKASAVRSRFDAAHELGHLVLHQFLTHNHVSNAAKFEQVESQAHAFARAFLMPERSFTAEVRAVTLDGLRSLKIRWQVAIQAMIERLYRLNVISDERRTHLWRLLSQRGWRRREPLDDMLQPEQPRILRKSFEMTMSAGLLSSPSVELLTGLYPREVADIAGLPENFFDRDDAPIRLIPRDDPVDRTWQERGDSLTLPLRRDRLQG